MKKPKIPRGETGWRFALLNGRLAEIYFVVGKGTSGIWAHCYVDKDKYDKSEKKMIAADIKKHQLIYRKRKYFSLKTKG